MPFAPVTNPDLAGEYLYRGITQAGQTLGGALGDLGEKLEQKGKERKAYLGLVDSMVDSGTLTPLERGRLVNEDTDTIKGYVDGKTVAATLGKMKQDAAEQQARAGLYTQQAADRAAELTNAQVQPEFMNAAQRYLAPTGNYEEASQTPQGRASMIAGEVTPGPMTPLRALARAARETGYTVRPGQLDDILRAVKYGQTPTVPPGFTPTKVDIGGVTYELPPAPVTVPPGFSASQIVVGNDGKPRYTLEPTPPAPAIPATMQPRTVTLDAKGRPTVTYAEPDATRKLAADYPWLLDDDIEKFKAGLRTIQDPAERNAVIQTRDRYETATGRPTMLERFLTGGLPGGAPAAPAKAAKQSAQTPAPGARAPGTLATPATNSNDRVKVIGPDGKEYTLPRRQLSRLPAGYKVAP